MALVCACVRVCARARACMCVRVRACASWRVGRLQPAVARRVQQQQLPVRARALHPQLRTRVRPRQRHGQQLVRLAQLHPQVRALQQPHQPPAHAFVQRAVGRAGGRVGHQPQPGNGGAHRHASQLLAAPHAQKVERAVEAAEHGAAAAAREAMPQRAATDAAGRAGVHGSRVDRNQLLALVGLTGAARVARDLQASREHQQLAGRRAGGRGRAVHQPVHRQDEGASVVRRNQQPGLVVELHGCHALVGAAEPSNLPHERRPAVRTVRAVIGGRKQQERVGGGGKRNETVASGDVQDGRRSHVHDRIHQCERRCAKQAEVAPLRRRVSGRRHCRRARHAQRAYGGARCARGLHAAAGR